MNHNNNNNDYTLYHNQFSTWDDLEYKSLLNIDISQISLYNNVKLLNEAQLPQSLDWRESGIINEIQNQGQCGSCWAFSATAAIEGHNKLKGGDLLKLSEQQLVDCDSNSHGCNGGLQQYGMEYAKQYGQMLQKDYPYTGKTQQCKQESGKEAVYVTNIHKVLPYSVTQLKSAINKGPVSVTVEADNKVFQFYRSGILNSIECGTNLDHAVTAIGYGQENGQEYYLIRNSWGSSWGDNGYIKIAAIDGYGICGIQQLSVWPDVQQVNK